MNAPSPSSTYPADPRSGRSAISAPPFRLVPLPLGYESMEPLRGVEPRKPSVRRTTGRRPERHGCRARTRTSIRGFRGRCPAIRRPGIEHGRRESDPHRGEVWARRLCLWVMPACAARDSNPVRRSKSPEHSHTCSRHVKRMPCHPGLDVRTRTYGFLLPKQAPYRSATPSRVEMAGIEPATATLAGRARYL
jgi:hypothetical protein